MGRVSPCKEPDPSECETARARIQAHVEELYLCMSLRKGIKITR